MQGTPPNTFKLFLLRGGINTFLPLFYQFLHKMRMELGLQAEAEAQPSAPTEEDAGLNPETQTVVRSA